MEQSRRASWYRQTGTLSKDRGKGAQVPTPGRAALLGHRQSPSRWDGLALALLGMSLGAKKQHQGAVSRAAQHRSQKRCEWSVYTLLPQRAVGEEATV